MAERDENQPVIVANELWTLIRQDLKLSRPNRIEIDDQLAWFKRNPEYMERVTARATPYLHLIVEDIQRRGLPVDLALLPVIESAFQTNAYSRGRASGLWQFVAATAKRFGLRQNWWYDERRDVVAATAAALEYLSTLHKQFDGDWLLALAAYNCGENKVARAIKQNLRNGKPGDFWSLKLPKETRSYVPRLLAVAAVVADPGAYGVTLTPIPNRRYLAVVDLGAQTDLAEVARLAGMNDAEFGALNAAFRRGVTPPEGPHSVVVPVAKVAQLNAGIASLTPEQRLPWPLHRVRPGDTLGAIALKYGSSVGALQRVNKIRGTLIRASQTLIVPRGINTREPVVASRRAAHGATYTVRSGDTLWDIARHHGIRLADILSWNGLDRHAVLRPGKKLAVKALVTTNKQTRDPQQYNTTASDEVILCGGSPADSTFR